MSIAKNQTRVDWIEKAKTALGPYCEGGEEIEDALRDLLADLMHLAESADLEFQSALEVAEQNYIAERQEQA